jgi:hypothetical protein
VLAHSGDVDAGWNGPAQVDLGVPLEDRLGLTEVRPGKERERQIEGGGIPNGEHKTWCAVTVFT